MLSTTVLATKAPIVIAPAMNPNMYSNKITHSNINKLKKVGYHFIDPEYGKIACGIEGVGRLARIPVIIDKVIELLEAQDKEGKKE